MRFKLTAGTWEDKMKLQLAYVFIFYQMFKYVGAWLISWRLKRLKYVELSQQQLK